MQARGYVELQRDPLPSSGDPLLKCFGILLYSQLIMPRNEVYFALNLSNGAGDLGLSLADLLVQGVLEERCKLPAFHRLVHLVVLVITVGQTVLAF